MRACIRACNSALTLHHVYVYVCMCMYICMRALAGNSALTRHHVYV